MHSHRRPVEPHHRRRVGSVSNVWPQTMLVPTPSYSHVSRQRARYMEVRLFSPEMSTSRGNQQPISVYGERDQVGGQVILHPGCPEAGRINITLEGAFLYCPETPMKAGESFFDDQDVRKSVFLTTTQVLTVEGNTGEPTTPATPRSAIREAFGPRRRPSVPTLKMQSSYSSQERSFPFIFDLPRGARPGEDKPPTYSSLDCDPNDQETFDIIYSVTVVWQATDLSLDSVHMNIPIMIHTDRDFSSLDVLSEQAPSWLEMPLRCDRPAPYKCAVTLPTSVTFSRPSSIPFFVVFTTTPRNPDLAREITADATISVSLLRQIQLTEAPAFPPTPPMTPQYSSSGSDESGEISRSSRLFKLKRAVKSTRSLRGGPLSPSILSPINPILGPLLSPTLEEPDKPLPRLPQQTVWTQSRILHTCFSPGFPKRPRLNNEGRKHPSLEEIASLPDGLFKSKIPLEKEMLQSVDWPGVSVKYYLDISVLVRQEDFRARVPIRIL